MKFDDKTSPGGYSGNRLWSFQCLIDWLEVRAREGHKFPSNVGELAADIDHSVLLQRLTEGKQPLLIAPPRSFSTPWYELIEKGEASPFEVYPVANFLVIDQFEWKILNKVSNEEYIVTYGEEVDKFRVFVGSPPTVYPVSLRPGASFSPGRKNWKIVKL